MKKSNFTAKKDKISIDSLKNLAYFIKGTSDDSEVLHGRNTKRIPELT
jgi:hypothetical protein